MIGAGVPLCFLSVLVTGPLLLKWLNPKKPLPFSKATLRSSQGSDARSYRYPWAVPVLVTTLLTTALAAWSASRVDFDFDLSNIRRQGLGFAELDEQERTLVRASYSPVVVSYSSEATMEQDYDMVLKEIEEGRFPEVSRVLSIRTVIPKDAEARGAILAEIAELGRNPAIRYLPPAIAANLQRLVEREEGKPFTLRREDLPPALLAILGANAGKHRMLLLPSGNMWDIREAAQLRDAINEKLPGRQVAGEYVSLGLLYKLVRADGPRVVLLAFSLVALFMLFDIRKPARIAWALSVLVMGLVLAVGVMPLAGLRFNIVNLVGVPICVGTGIEATIFLTHRLAEEGRGGIRRALLTTGMASAMCMLTTLLGFASLMMAESRGIQSLGRLVLLADAVVTFGAFILLPAGTAVAYRYTREAGKVQMPDPS